MNRNAFSIATKRPYRRIAAGFSLIELMVAMVIGMLGIVVMMQVFSVFEGQKRTTTGGDDAISSGAIALYGIQRVVQQSGWGMSAVQLIGCSVSGLSLAGSADLPLVPVTINSALITGQDANTDTLLVLSGSGNGTVDGDAFTQAAATGASPYWVHTPTAFATGDRVVVAPVTRPSPCALAVSPVTNPAPTLGSAVTAGAAPFNIASGDLLFNLGNAPTARAYAIRDGNLTMCDYTTANCGAAGNNGNPAIWVPIANNIVSLRAQYGRDTTDVAPLPTANARMDGGVEVWDQSSTWTAATIAVSAVAAKNTAACALLRVAAVRIALVARSSQPEKQPSATTHVTEAANAPVWFGSATLAIVPPSPDLTWPTWEDFRYKVFQTVVPLRNTTSQGAVSEC